MPEAPIQPDPLAKLHKMSTTAGLGSGDYVAVNVPAVVALLLGLLSFLLLAGFSNLLLIIPGIGVVLGIVALYQIRRSNGTQTGGLVALLGVALSLGLGGYVLARQGVSYAQSRSDRQEVADLITRFSDHFKAGQFEQAHQLFSPGFQKAVPQDKFRERMAFFTAPEARELYGDFVEIKWNGHTVFERDSLTGEQQAITVGLLKFTKTPEPFRLQMTFRQNPSRGWTIDNVPELFRSDNPQQQPGEPAPR